MRWGERPREPLKFGHSCTLAARGDARPTPLNRLDVLEGFGESESFFGIDIGGSLHNGKDVVNGAKQTAVD